MINPAFLQQPTQPAAKPLPPALQKVMNVLGLGYKGVKYAFYYGFFPGLVIYATRSGNINVSELFKP